MVNNLNNNLINKFVHSGNIIALAGVGVVFTFILLIDKEILLTPLMVVYILSITSLLYNRFEEQETDLPVHPERTNFLKKYFKYSKFIIFFSLAISIIILLIANKINAMFFIIFWYLLMIIYTLYFKKLTSKIIGFKNVYFALTVTFLIIFISLFYSYTFLNVSFLIIFIFIFLRILVNNIFLDIKDISNDKKYNLKTLPIIFSYKKIILILKIMSLLSGLVLILGVFFNFIPRYSLFLLFTIPYSFYYFKKSEKKENFYLVNYILADGEFILWPISVIIGKTIL